jgi:hypothetical protein
MPRKPETALEVSVFTAILVYGIFQVEVGASLSDVKHDTAHSSLTKGSVNSAAWTSAAVVAGISLLSKDPTVFVVGGAVAAALIWKYKQANMTNPATGQVTMPPTAGTNMPSNSGNGPA